MQPSPLSHAETLTRSYLDWWKLAGVENVCADESVDWLAPPVTRPAEEKPKRALHETLANEVLVTKPPIDWPSDLTLLQNAIAGETSLPGTTFSSRRAAPIGNAQADLLVIGDFPEETDCAAGKFGAGPVGELLTNMLRAINVSMDRAYVTALAHSRPASGALQPNSLTELADFARHHLKLAAPKRLLIIGSEACKALTGQDLMESRGRLLEINHEGGKWAAVATFHPRTLLQQPALKAQAWRDLQMLANKD